MLLELRVTIWPFGGHPMLISWCHVQGSLVEGWTIVVMHSVTTSGPSMHIVDDVGTLYDTPPGIPYRTQNLVSPLELLPVPPLDWWGNAFDLEPSARPMWSRVNKGINSVQIYFCKQHSNLTFPSPSKRSSILKFEAYVSFFFVLERPVASNSFGVPDLL